MTVSYFEDSVKSTELERNNSFVATRIEQRIDSTKAALVFVC